MGLGLSEAPGAVSFSHEQFYPFTYAAKETEGKNHVSMWNYRIEETHTCCRVGPQSSAPIYTPVGSAEFF